MKLQKQFYLPIIILANFDQPKNNLNTKLGGIFK